MAERCERLERGVESLTLRPMRSSDLDEVLENETSSYQFPWSRGVFEDCLRAGYECWVLLRAGRIIGHGILSTAAEEAHLLNVCIGLEHQGCGHGRALVRHLLDRARGRARTVFLEVRPSNLAALTLYESLGFNEVGMRRDYYPAALGREDALVLALELLRQE